MLIDSNEELLSKLLPLEKKLQYTFKDKALLLKSMLHSSFVNENPLLQLKSNERLEFLGDTVLELVISHHLVSNLKNKDEGVLSLKRSALVRGSSLTKLSKQLRLHNFLIVGKGEKKEDGSKRESVLCDALEAVFGAIYLDGGLEAAREVILKIFSPLLKDLHVIEQHYNFKNQLQELTQEKYQATPQYKLIGQEGPEHKKSFRVSVYLKDIFITYGTSTSIKKAEQICSKNALNLLKIRSSKATKALKKFKI
ncbi:MAG: hypothetical protein ACD_79C01447G0004 [uncultured bacterium]|nr:MAG: hypothetical protein ACD_79C01447G0004 [uncultured bacterium]